MKKRQEKRIKRSFKKSIYLLITTILLVVITVQVYSSLIFKRPDRINLFILDERPTFLSVSTTGESNYILNLYSDLKIKVPGGFGFYRVGALNKLVDLEKDPSIFKRALSGTTLTFTDYYFYPKKVDINYGKKEDIKIIEPSIKNILLNRSNAGFFDRVYLGYKLLTLKKNSIRFLDAFEKVNEKKDLAFDSERFEEEYNGLFFQSTYRNERLTVQILYTNEYSSAVMIAQILENSGIRVVYISKNKKADNSCKIKEKEKSFSQTAINLGRFFSCKVETGEPGISDIIFQIGDIEKKWVDVQK